MHHCIAVLLVAVLAAPALAGKRAHARLAIELHGPREGIASFYGSPRSRELTAAHRTLPFGTQVRVTNRNNGKAVVVRINDRGPFIKGRVIDVSHAAARALGMIQSGLALVRMVIVKPPRGHVVPHRHKA